MSQQNDRIAAVFEECLSACAIFERAERPLVERESIKREGKGWIALAAGIDPQVAGDIFRTSGKRGKFAELPGEFIQAGLLLRISLAGQQSWTVVGQREVE